MYRISVTIFDNCRHIDLYRVVLKVNPPVSNDVQKWYFDKPVYEEKCYDERIVL